LHTIHGYGISLLFFITGIVIPVEKAEVSHASGQTVKITEVEYDQEDIVIGQAQVIRMTEPSAKAERSLPQLAPVRSDHEGKRKPVPQDPQKRCPHLEPVFEAYGLYPVQTWSYIAWRESGCRPKAQNATWDADGNMTYALNKNGSYDTGLVQINSSWRSVTAKVCGESSVENRMQGLKTIHCNLMVARYIMENSSGGLSNWRM
jgi:hypothetical protein